MPLSNLLIETMRQTGRSRVGFLSESTSRIQVRSVVSSSFAILWTVALQAPLSMGFSGREYWSGLPCLSSGDLPNPGIKSMSSMSPALVGEHETP